MGIKGTVRRSTDGHIIHANIDTDVIIAEEPPYGQFINYAYKIYNLNRLHAWICFSKSICVVYVVCMNAYS